MKITCISDLHGNLPDNIPECDVLVIAGDVCPDYLQTLYGNSVKVNKGEQKQSLWLSEHFEPWLKCQRAKHIVGIAGNHDFVFEKKFLVPELSWIYLEDSEVTIDGVKFYGTPWVPNLPFWAFYGTERVLELRTKAIPDDVNVLISHGPPYGYGDIAGAKYGDREGLHVGDVPLLERIKEIKPPLVVCGHIHEGRGNYVIDTTTTLLHNVSYVDVTYTPYDLPFVEINYLTYDK